MNKLRLSIRKTKALTSFQNFAVKCYTMAVHSYNILLNKVQHFASKPTPNGRHDDENKLCRLRQGLNYDCLIKIFEYLSVSDLIRLCETDIYFQNLILSHVIGRKVIDFTKSYPLWRKRKIFEVFGKSMRKIKMDKQNAGGDFEWFLNLVIQYCSIGRLTELELVDFNLRETHNMEQAVPFFSNLRKLTLIQDNGAPCNRFLARISATAKNLTHLTLECTHLPSQWLSAGGMTNLKELRLHFIEDPINGLPEFLRTKSQLEVLVCIDCTDIFPTVASTLAKHCPRLKTFVDCSSHYSNSVNRMEHYYGKKCLSNQTN